MKIAYLSPLPPQPSGIADYSAELLPYLARLAEIDLFVDSRPLDPEIAARFVVHDWRDLESRRVRSHYDTFLYQMGNHLCHEHVYQSLSRYPGVTVLHDHVLYDLVHQTTIARGDELGFLHEMSYSHGAAGLAAARRLLREGIPLSGLQYPTNRRVLDASLGLIVHSDYVRRLIAAEAPDTTVAVVPHHFVPTDAAERGADVRRRLGLGEETLLVASFGLATPEKRLEPALRAFRAVRERYPDARYAIVGALTPEHDLRPTIAELGLADAVTVTGYVAKDDLLGYIAAADVAVCLRFPTMGETSGVLLRALGAGRPTIVSNVGAFAELPDDCCVKVPVGEPEEEALREAMLALAADRSEREALGERARRHVMARHSIEGSATAYVTFLESLIA